MHPIRIVVLAVLAAAGAAAASASTVLGLSIEDQARLSKLVVLGEVRSLAGVVDPVGGIETQVRLEATRVLAGKARPGDVVTFHLRGGEVKGVISHAIGEADLRVGQRVLVFVEEVDGRDYLLGLSMGAWDVFEDDAGRISLMRSVQDGLAVVGEAKVEHGPVDLLEMAARVERAKRHPRFDEPMLRDAVVGATP